MYREAGNAGEVSELPVSCGREPSIGADGHRVLSAAVSADAWWGPGFTEWTHVAAARPLFRGHVQPRLPGELGFYDLRLPETRAAQAELATSYGADCFCYWHYWFGGTRLLDETFDDVIASSEPVIKFCLGWANEPWTAVWAGRPWRAALVPLRTCPVGTTLRARAGAASEHRPRRPRNVGDDTGS